MDALNVAHEHALLVLWNQSIDEKEIIAVFQCPRVPSLLGLPAVKRGFFS
jgi:hypothetical protein